MLRATLLRRLSDKPPRSWHAPTKKNTGVPGAIKKAIASAERTAAEEAEAAERAHAASMAEPTAMMKFVRKVRTFEPRVFLHKHVFAVYWSLVLVGFIYANYLQYNRMQKLYPDYDVVARKSGAQYGSMKEQELVDVQAFNARAANMRADLKARM